MFCEIHKTTVLFNISVRLPKPSTNSTYRFSRPHSRRQNSPQHNQAIRNQIRNPHPQYLKRQRLLRSHHILEHQHRDPPGQAPGQKRKPKKQHHSGLPSNSGARVGEGVGGEPGLLDAVDDEHAEGREDQRQPVDEFDVDIGAVEVVRPDGRVEESVECYCELHTRISNSFILLTLPIALPILPVQRRGGGTRACSPRMLKVFKRPIADNEASLPFTFEHASQSSPRTEE
jgi:hypothetical protein